jgi:transposase-like protein
LKSPVIFIDAIVVKVRDGQVRNKPVYVVIGVTVHGRSVSRLLLQLATTAADRLV